MSRVGVRILTIIFLSLLRCKMINYLMRVYINLTFLSCPHNIRVLFFNFSIGKNVLKSRNRSSMIIESSSEVILLVLFETKLFAVKTSVSQFLNAFRSLLTEEPKSVAIMVC